MSGGGNPWRARVWREAGSSGAYVDMDADVRPDGERLDTEAVGDGYPRAGTVADVLEWVGESPDRAAWALGHERIRNPSRAGVLTPLARMVGEVS